MYLIILLVILAISLLIRFVIRPAMVRSSSASNLALYQHHLASLHTPFALRPGETVIASCVARDLGAVRSVSGDSPTEDAFPGSFPLVYCTSDRLIVLMSTTDAPTAITGTYPVRQPNLRHRIGEQFDESNGRFVSSAGWDWETIGMIVAEQSQVGLSWTDREGVGVVLLGFVYASDLSTFVNRAVSIIQKRREASALAPTAPDTEYEGDQTTYTFEKPLVRCSRCSAPIAEADRFCTGCGAPVTQVEHA